MKETLGTITDKTAGGVLLGNRRKLHAHGPGCHCFIIPQKVLARFARDKKLSAKARKVFADAAKFEKEWRKVRLAKADLYLAAKTMLPSGLIASVASAPAITVFDCKNGTTLPGAPVANPGSSADATAKQAFVEASAVADFYKKIFGRNSVDNAGMTLASSVHYSVKYNNAFWNGSQMTYGDGDGNIFVDFTRSSDVIGHELTHGVTQFTAGLAYANQPGGLNESISDVFGSMFRQWQVGQDVTKADWLIGKEIMGPGAIATLVSPDRCANPSEAPAPPSLDVTSTPRDVVVATGDFANIDVCAGGELCEPGVDDVPKLAVARPAGLALDRVGGIGNGLNEDGEAGSRSCRGFVGACAVATLAARPAGARGLAAEVRGSTGIVCG